MNKIIKTQAVCEGTMKLLGDYWTLRIIDALKNGEMRYCDIQRCADNVNPVTLTKRLKKLEAAKLVKRSEETVDKISVTYDLTGLGQDVLPVIKALYQFSVKAKLNNKTTTLSD
ncbi:MAG: helix-turn-helix transcriptional regulator [bacterium]|nr:helix-turn-helix transcriptional regulator [bacterium]